MTRGGRSGGEQGGRLLLAAGALTLVNNYLPGSGHLDLAVLNTVALLTLALGAVSLVLPWQRLPARAPLALVPIAFALIVVSNYFGGVSNFSYAVYFVVVFVWIGLSQPPGTAFVLSPLAALAYLLPFLLDDDPPPNAISSVTVAIPVCVLVGEVLARSVRRLDRSREDLRRRVEHEQAVVDALADGVVVVDDQNSVRSCNRVAETLLGQVSSELVGKRFPLPVLDAPLQHPLHGRWVETAVTPLGETGERVVVLRDVSRQRALDEAKDLFLATTSHELRTPLTAIKGYVNTLQRHWDALDEQRRVDALATVAERTDALVALTNHLLLGARAGAARHSARSEPFDLGRGVRDALQNYEHISPRHEIVLDVAPAPVTALGDPSSIEPVLGQLVENAIKYSPDGGCVRVAVRGESGRASVEVADQGVGFPDGQEEAVFTPFFQAGDANTREYGGVGLGLYIVRQLVEAQGGTVSARNRPEGGASLVVTLPLLPDPTRSSDDADVAQRVTG